MKLSIRYFALMMMGAMICGCAEEVEDAQPSAGGTVTMKTTVSLDERASTRALTEAGVKTFAASDKIAVVYEQESGTAKAVSVALTDADITNSGKDAAFTITLTNPKAGGKVRYIYPATMAADDVSGTTPDNDATIKWTNLNTQDGLLSSLDSKLDLATFDGTMTAQGNLPSTATLENQLTIGKFTIKNTTDADITSAISKLTIGDGSNTYTVNRTAAEGPIYVAMKPIASTQSVTVNATAGTNNYTKSVKGNDLAASNIYDITVKVIRKITYLKYTSATDSSYVDVLTTNATIWTGTVSTGDIEVSAGTYIVEGTATCDGKLTLLGEVNLILLNGSKLTVAGGIASSSQLNIFGQGISSSMGQLVVNSSSGNSAIKVNDKDLTIHGGKVVANAMDNGGHGIFTYGGSFTLYNGVLDASSHNYGFGIYSTSANPISIYNGNVTARGGNATSSIEGGIGICNGNGDVIIKDAVVKAYGGAGSDTKNGGWGIKSELDLEISGKSDVYAEGGKNYHAIYSKSGNITISGGNVEAVAGEDADGALSAPNITIGTEITLVKLTKGKSSAKADGWIFSSDAINGRIKMGKKTYTAVKWNSLQIGNNITLSNFDSSGLDLARSDEVLTLKKHE